jgi:hypothetical protein
MVTVTGGSSERDAPGACPLKASQLYMCTGRAGEVVTGRAGESSVFSDARWQIAAGRFHKRLA